MKFNSRYLLVAIGLLAVVSGLIYRVITLQIVDQNFLRTQGDMRTIRVAETPAYRGMIMDRNGEPFAVSTPVNSVWLNPQEFEAKHAEMLALAVTLDVPLEQLLDKIARHQGREFVYLARHITPITAEQVKLLGIAGIHLKQELKRYYPAGEVASHVVGFTNIDGRGNEGIEKAFDSWLSGAAGSKRVLRDRRGREVQVLEGLKETHSGQDVVLSLDQRLQYLAYRELKAAVVSSKAVAGSAIVLDVETGEVLAMVNQPSFNPNLRVVLQKDGRYRNRSVTDEFEPGSVLKTFSVVNALQHGDYSPSTLVNTSPGRMAVGRNTVQEDKHKDFGVIDISTILQKSSNVGVAKLTLSLPAKYLIDTYSKLGFGVSTGSGFPGERSGTLVQPPKNGQFMLATMSFGYGLSVTPLQLAQAYAVIGAGGVKHQVTFLKQERPSVGKKVIDSVVARQVVDMLAEVVDHGSGRQAKVVGYYTAGKTGTTRKPAPQGGYQENSHVAVFAGLVPASNPKFAIVVMIDDPRTDLYYGSQLAAPVFAKIASGAVRLFNVAPDEFGHELKLRVAQADKVPSQHE